MAAIRERVEKIKKVLKKFYDKHTIRRIALTIVAVVVLVYVIVSIPVWTLGKESPAQTASRQPLSGSQISLDAGKVTVASNGGKTLSINTAQMTVEVKDDATGYTFSSAAKGTAGSELALLSLTYLGEDNNLYEWNSYDYSAALSTYSLYQIENGVRIDMNLNEGESNRFYEYLPKKMSIETYEELFVGGLNALMDSGALDKTLGERYLSTLGLVYRRSLTEECYAVTYTGNPPTSATNQLIEVTKLVGYTQDMLMDDAETFEFTVTFTEPAEFDLTVELTLDDNGDLKVHIPTGSIVNHNDYYTAQSIAVLPNFGASTVEEYEDGAILVPDGSGALMAFNSYIANVADYKRPYFDNDFYSDYYYMPEYAEELYMPVYGVMYGAEEKTQKGFLAILEEGARTAYLNVKLASAGADSAKYNKAYVSFETAQYKRVKINGEYSENSGTYLVNAGMQDLDLTIRYQFYGKGVTYYDMAKGYQSYLAEKTGTSAEYGDGAAQMYLEVVGGLNIASRFVGIPYSKAYSMTTYENLLAMMEDLDGMKFSMQYDGAFNGGWNGEMNRGAGLAGQNGSKSNLKKALSYAGEHGIPLYMQVALTQVWESGNGFRASRHAVRDYANDEVELSRYQPVLGILNKALNDGTQHDSYYLLSPGYLSTVTQKFLAGAGDYDSLAISDLAGMYYADYRYEGYVSGETGNNVLNENLERLSQNRTLALTNPHIDKIGYGSVATDVSRESSDYATFAATIPFKQLVMNGLIDYTTEDVNLSSRNAAYFVLQSAELGSWPKFLLTWENVDVLKNSDFSYLYAAQFELLRDKIEEVYEECADIRGRIGTEEITGHRVLEDGVYETTYASGAVVIVNYNLYDVTLEGGTALPAESYLIKEGR
ncbi:MAG: hypothetical protein HDR26_05210 [Lachnospiraceae bacterium]|nr:hypothetical protein [Lachnospiraceae bacterium]